MFIRKKIIKGSPHFYLVENRREAGKVKQKVLAYLGYKDTIEGAIIQRQRWIESLNRSIEPLARKVQQMEGARARLLAERGIEPTPHPKPSRESRTHKYWRTVGEVEKRKKKIYELETQIDRLNLYRSA